MNDRAEKTDSEAHDLPHDLPHQLPRPIIRKMRWPVPLIWLVPIAAAVLAGFYAWQHHKERGPEITIEFSNASGIKADDSSLIFRGVEIGKVTSLDLSSDNHRALVHVQLQHGREAFAQQGSQFWIVRPEISETNVSGLTTIISGPYLEARPGSGETESNFYGFDHEPTEAGKGVMAILHTAHLDHLEIESPVFYRGLQVGMIKDIRFSSDATEVNVTLVVWQRYRNLLRTNSVFWTEPGADVKGGLFSGVKVDLKSIHTLLTGGVVFATPEDIGPPADDGTSYRLHDEPNKDWLGWQPKIALEQEPTTSPGGQHRDAREDVLPTKVKKQ